MIFESVPILINTKSNAKIDSLFIFLYLTFELILMNDL